jgi:hypothetical protein
LKINHLATLATGDRIWRSCDNVETLFVCSRLERFYKIAKRIKLPKKIAKKSQNKIAKQNCETKSQNQIAKRNRETKSRNEIAKRNRKAKLPNEIAKRNREKKSRNEIAKRNRETKSQRAK